MSAGCPDATPVSQLAGNRAEEPATMNDAVFHLRHDVVLEPLVDRWFAWTHLIAPLTAAMNIVERHIRLMESFIAAPALHAVASRNPRLQGGKFLDLAAERIDEVRALLEKTQQRVNVVALHEAVGSCFDNVRAQVQGGSLEPLYRLTPEPLRGCVEYVYDISGRPDIHFFEPLLYRSQYYDPSMQSILIRRLLDGHRPFMMSTPRLTETDDVHWTTDFRSTRIDALSRLRYTKAPWPIIAEELEESGLPVMKMKRFFCEGGIPRPDQGEIGSVRWRYFGHACLLFEGGDASILVDPVVAYDAYPDISHYGFSDLPDRIDLVLITHNHSDHVNIETLLALRERIGTILVPEGGGRLQDPSLKLALEAIGFRNVRALAPFETAAEGRAVVTAVPFLGEHADLDIRTKCGYHIAYEHWSAMCVADSANLDPCLYDHIRETLGRTHTLFVGMECEGAPLSWVYGPLLCGPIEHAKDKARRLAGSNEAQAERMAVSLGCEEIFVYAMGVEPWVQFITSVASDKEGLAIQASERFVAACRERGVRCRRLYGKDESHYPCG